MSSLRDIARAAAWNKANRERRSAARRERYRRKREEQRRQAEFWERRKAELIAERGKEKALKRLEYERNKEAYLNRAKSWTNKNIERRREVGRQWAAKTRAADPDLARQKDREKYQKNKRAYIEKSVVWAANNPKDEGWFRSNRHKIEARALARIARLCGEIDASQCADCGSNESIEMHHEDYSRPLDVVPLCRPCHRKRHA